MPMIALLYGRLVLPSLPPEKHASPSPPPPPAAKSSDLPPEK